MHTLQDILHDFRVTPTAVRHLAVMLTAICCEKHKGEQYLGSLSRAIRGGEAIKMILVVNKSFFRKQ